MYYENWEFGRSFDFFRKSFKNILVVCFYSFWATLELELYFACSERKELLAFLAFFPGIFATLGSRE